MKLNLIIDGNYALSKVVFTLNKHNLLYGALYSSLENMISNWRRWYPFDGTYFVSDSKKKSWRKDFIEEYKSTRKKDDSIDWDFVYDTYSEFKKSLKIKVIEGDWVEGDDWISYITDKKNNKGESCLIVTNDYDIKQKVKMDIESGWINIMANEMFNKEKVFLPENWRIFLDKKRNEPNNDIFNLNNNADFVELMDRFTNKSDIIEVDWIRSLLVKVISGDKSDNIKSIFITESKSGEKRGIGERGAETIYDTYLNEIGQPDINDPELSEDFADIICEKKKLTRDYIPEISENFKKNLRLIYLCNKNLPKNILQKISSVYDSK